MSKADIKRVAGTFDPPLVRGDDGGYYFIIRVRDGYGETGTLYVPVNVRDRELTYLDAQGRRHRLPIMREDLANPGRAEGRFVRFKAFRDMLTFEARYMGGIIYIPVLGRWYPDDNDHYGRYVFTVRAAEGEPDSRFLKNYKLDMFLNGQTYHYKTRKELFGGSGSGAVGALGGLALLGGWLATIGTIVAFIANNGNPDTGFGGVGYEMLFGLISIITIGATIWIIHSALQEKSPYHLNHVPDVTSPRENTVRREGNNPSPHSDDESSDNEPLPFYS